MYKPLWIALGITGSLSALGQSADHWSTYVQNAHRYRVISPFETMHSSFAGLQVDTAILNNEKQGFVLKEAGFRVDAQTGAISCLELVYLAPAQVAPVSIAVELIAFDVRYPLQRAATYHARLANVPNTADGSLVRCQIPISGPVTQHLGFVVVAKPPFSPLRARKATAYAKAGLQEGHWAGSEAMHEVFIYPPTPGISPYVDPTYVPYFVDQDIMVEEVIEMQEPPPPPPMHVTQLEGSTEEILQRVEKMPSFPGGEQAMLQFISQNLKYPTLALENEIRGTVVAQFVVEKDGSLSDIKVIRDIGAGCGKEALRVINQMPKWIPGRQNGSPVRVQYTLPIRFMM